MLADPPPPCAHVHFGGWLRERAVDSGVRADRGGGDLPGDEPCEDVPSLVSQYEWPGFDAGDD